MSLVLLGSVGPSSGVVGPGCWSRDLVMPEIGTWQEVVHGAVSQAFLLMFHLDFNDNPVSVVAMTTSSSWFPFVLATLCVCCHGCMLPWM